MLWRACTFLLALLVAALAGWWLGRELGVGLGVVGGSLAWFLLDASRGARVLRWLRAGAVAQPPLASGLWGELGERIRRALRTREQRADDAERRLTDFLAAIQASPNGVVLLDEEGRIEWSNGTAADHFGLDAERDLQQLVGNLVRDPAFAGYMAQGDFSRDVVIPGRDPAAAVPRRLSVQLHPYGSGRKLLLSRDVTAIDQADTMRRDFVANVSHEIRTPLTVLAGFIETMQQLPLEESDRARYLAMMAQQSQRMQTLVSDLLTLSRLEGSPLPGTGEWTPVGALLAQCEQEARALAVGLGKQQDLVVDAVEGRELAGAAPELLSAMSNLVTNAVRYTPANGHIRVRWRDLADGRGEFAVDDTGPGIAREHLPRLTERFYRVDRSRSRETGGTGLGLAIVKHVAQRHGAELRIHSTPGTGSTFSIVFAAARLRTVSAQAGDVPAPPATATP
ncbi:phosphate regulon sensor histidine kinase PhoR [Ramlibacter algicola]|uniref:Phosphate regulon sensor protein PhoR n=1 Tax=Ramlibacter algicola TaxID=2795217 RepID=A0A934Q2G8_9BURK|nr:phosphate regulon sensor histidine kinase PhoR [Ramlibacter algicola]MBK0393588.1 phosphate regulon sensor histidine kinase PhoR [Ramlibacter algicola]